MEKIFLIIGSLSGFIGVALGAFATHGLKNKLTPDLFNIFETGVRYQMYHALVLLGTAWAVTRFANVYLNWAGWCFIAGTILFSGSLYILCLSGARWWGAVTPLGGLAFLAGWLLLVWGVWKG
jgi:uncharacterized membrane protein YgdD (TMEM256/DUF423 family)